MTRKFRSKAGQSLFKTAAVAGALMGTIPAAHAATPFPGVTSSSKFCIYYGGDFGTTNMNLLKTFNVVVIDPNQATCTPAVVATLQAAGVKVIGYISIGEDVASYNASTLITGDGLGPVHCDTTTHAIVYENQGIASFYVDQFYNGTSYVSDNVPDQNPNFHGYMIWPNTSWRSTLVNETTGNTTGRNACGLNQMTGTRTSNTDTVRTHNFGCDGYFLDTLDTSGPYDNVPGYYSWTAQEMSNTVAYIHNNYAGKLVLANRGFFFYNPDITSTVFNIHPYDYDIRPYVNGELFESYYLDSNAANTGINPSWNDNNLNAARKMMAESNRPDGFTVFSLDYQCARGTTFYNQGIQESIVKNGWTTYQSTDGSLNDVNTYVRDHLPAADTIAPVWSTTGTPGFVGAGTPPTYPARTGVQMVTAGALPGQAIVQWDLAQDQTGPVKYNILQSSSAAFTSPTTYSNVAYSVGAGWNLDTTTHNANQYTISGLTPGATYYFRVQAVDALAHADTNTATISYVVPASPPQVSNPVLDTGITVNGAITDWAKLTSFGTKANDVSGAANPVDWNQGWIANDTGSFYIAIQNANAITLNSAYNIFLDTDNNRSTGYTGGANNFPVGAEYMVQGSTLYKYTGGSGTAWSWASVGTLTSGVSSNTAEIKVPRSWIGSPASINLFFYGDNTITAGTVDVYPTTALVTGGGGGYFVYRVADVTNPVTSTQITVNGSLTDWAALTSFGAKPDDLSGAANPVDWEKGWLAHDTTNLYIGIQNQNAITLNSAYTEYLDTDNDKTTGFIGGAGTFPIGADYMVQGATVYHYTGTGTNWSWLSVGTATTSVSGNTAEIKFARSLVGSPSIVKLFFYGDNTITSGTVDLYPQNALTSANGFFAYRLDDVANSGATITVDGALTEWSALRPFPLKVDDTTGATNPIDFEQVSVANNTTNIYFGIKNANAITFNWGYYIYIDSDNSSATGYKGGAGTFPLGADYMIEGNTLYSYAGTGTTFVWNTVATLIPTVSGTTAELAVAKTQIGSPTLFKFFLYGDNAAFSGTAIDTYPINVLTGGSALSYRVN